MLGNTHLIQALNILHSVIISQYLVFSHINTCEIYKHHVLSKTPFKIKAQLKVNFQHLTLIDSIVNKIISLTL